MQEAHFEDITACLQVAEREVAWAREELGGERNHHIAIEDKFSTTLEVVMNMKVVEAIKRAHIEAEVEKERILKGAPKSATAKYLASNAFEILKDYYFWEGFKNF